MTVYVRQIVLPHSGGSLSLSQKKKKMTVSSYYSKWVVCPLKYSFMLNFLFYVIFLTT